MSTRIRLLAATTVALLAATALLSTRAAEPKPSAIDDARAQARIETTYQLNPYLRADRLDVSVTEGVATLKGSVAAEVSKELAGAIAGGIEGVNEVDNQLLVEAATTTAAPRRFGEVVDDSTIRAAITSKLSWSRFADDLEVAVATRGGSVRLTGHARSAEARSAANRLAATTRGVGAVDDRVVVGDRVGQDRLKPATAAAPSSALSDTWITTKVKYTLLYSSNVAGSEIEVSTDHGVVSLKGTLQSGAERALAIELAQNIGGVKHVDADALVI